MDSGFSSLSGRLVSAGWSLHRGARAAPRLGRQLHLQLSIPLNHPLMPQTHNQIFFHMSASGLLLLLRLLLLFFLFAAGALTTANLFDISYMESKEGKRGKYPVSCIIWPSISCNQSAYGKHPDGRGSSHTTCQNMSEKPASSS